MIKKTILIAETNEKMSNEIINILEKMKDDIIILDTKPKTSVNLYENIIAYKPDIVITNENKEDFPATDVIQKIQSNLNIYQPEFIIISNVGEIEKVCRKKCIIAYYIKKPFEYKDIVECIQAIVSKIRTVISKNIKLQVNYNYSKENLEFIDEFIENNEKYYNKNEYILFLTKQYDLFDKIEKAFWNNPSKDVENAINEFDKYKDKVFNYRLCFLYQNLIHNL